MEYTSFFISSSADFTQCRSASLFSHKAPTFFRLRYTAPDAEFASIETVKRMFPTAKISGKRASAAGIPLLADRDTVYVNNETENTIIYGSTGSKKTRCCIAPLIASLASAEESMVITDVKGELATNPRLRGILDEHGYDTVFLDFRSFKGDGLNLLGYPYSQYKQDNADKAMENISRLVKALNACYASTRADPFWVKTSEMQATALFHFLLEICSGSQGYEKYLNMLSICSFANREGTDILIKILQEYYPDDNSNSISMLRGVLSAPDRTLDSIVVSTLSMLNPFLLQESLTRMLSTTTFSVPGMYEKPTAVFFIIPDECAAYDEIAGLLIDNLYSQLIDTYTRQYQNRSVAPRRIAFALDEFANVRLNDMGSKISACRSREIRMFLVCQSLKQLQAAYPDTADIILGNCQNTFFLNSSDPSLLDYICEMAGTTTITEAGARESLVSHGMLKKLRKTWEYKEALFLRHDLVFLTRLPDIDQYEHLKQFSSDTPAEIPVRQLKPLEVYSPAMFLEELQRKRIPVPFRSHNIPDIDDPDDQDDPDDHDIFENLGERIDKIMKKFLEENNE